VGAHASQVSYSLARLRSLGSDIDALVRAFEGKADQVRYDLDDLGHERVVRALDDAHDDWDDKREVLVTKLSSLRDMAVSSADTFEQVDEDLARKILEAMEDPR
jgi:predicted  nucleic acid-binding Zn-ribbon protein